MGGISETDAFTVGVRAGLWGFLARHYNGISDGDGRQVLDPTFTARIHS